MINSLYGKLVGGLVAAVMLLVLVAERSRWMHRAHAAEEQVAADCKAARASSHDSKMACSQTDEQIGFMGEAITSLSGSLARQNASIAAMGQETAEQVKAAQTAQKAAEKRAAAPQAASERLTASARASERQAKPCEPSKALKEAWR